MSVGKCGSFCEFGKWYECVSVTRKGERVGEVKGNESLTKCRYIWSR